MIKSCEHSTSKIGQEFSRFAVQAVLEDGALIPDMQTVEQGVAGRHNSAEVKIDRAGDERDALAVVTVCGHISRVSRREQNQE